jgi:hypothetical protein
LQILEEHDIQAEKGETLRTIGENNDIPPRDIYDLIGKD